MSRPPLYRERSVGASQLKAVREALAIAEARAKFWETWYQGAYYTAINGDEDDRDECEREHIEMQEAARVNESEDEDLIARIIANDPQGARYELN